MDPLDQSAPTYNSDDAKPAITRLMLEALPLGALVIDPQGKVVALNLQAEMLLGWSAPILEGQPAHEILQCQVGDPKHSSEDCPIARVLKGETVVDGHMLLRSRDGSLKETEYRCVSYPTQSGLGAILVLRDLTHQLELEKDLNRLASIAEESPIAIVELNEDANLIYANPTMMSLIERFGFSSRARPLILPANIAKLTVKCLHTQKEVAGIDVSVGGNHYEWKLVPVMRENLVRGYGVDLTARKRAEIELTQAKAKAEVASQAKSKFLANMSEEIRTPIKDILGQVELLTESGLNDQQFEYSKNIKSSSKLLMTSIDDLLAMAALEAGKITFEKTHFNFRSFMGKTAATFIPRAESKGLQLTVTISNQVPEQVYCDSSRLGQLLHNLIGNTIKFTEHGEVTIEVDRDTLSGHPGTDDDTDTIYYLFFKIRDTGIVIHRANHKIMVDRLTHADGSTNSAYDDRGWSLAVAKQLVELMGGTIGIENESGSGSKLWFSLPLQQLARKSAESKQGNKGRWAVI